jgi:SNF1-activating kinase 1
VKLTYLYRTHVADVDFDPVSGRKLLNQYEIVDEIGRGVHGKVKLGRNLETNDLVAIKIVDRYPKRRRLGKSQTPEDKVKKEVAILKKCRHPNVVSLLEVVDDPAKKKVYIVLEYVALGEIIWRKKGDKDVVAMERRRQGYEFRGLTEQEMRAEEARFLRDVSRRKERRERRRVGQPARSSMGPDFWSLEHGGDSEDDDQADIITNTIEEGIATTDFARHTDSRLVSAPTSHTASSRGSTPLPLELDIPPLDSDNEGDEPATTHSNRSNYLHRELDGTMYGAYVPEYRTRTPSITNSFSSHLSSEDAFDPYEEEHSYVPCLTIAQARQTFRDTVLGLEYLHYQGIIHRDIKPANLLWTTQHRVKISDFGVSYLGRPIRDDNSVNDSETDTETLDEAIELAKTVGTPAFYAPELCYTDFTKPRPSVTSQIDVWALGVTLYCLIFARLPFLAEDEFALFKAIAEDDVFIPRKRLKAANGCRATPISGLPIALVELASIDQRYENIDDDLYDLLKRLLLKDSTKRITLREVKRHPWVLHGIPDPIGWIEETDPSRQNEGKKIEVSTEDVEKAVVPIGIIERVRSGIRKVGQAIMGKGREREGGRHRTRSSVHSEESSPAPTAASFSKANVREGRRASLKGDELITAALRSNSVQRLH